MQYQNGGSMIAINDARNIHPGGYASITPLATGPVVPVPIYFEGILLF